MKRRTWIMMACIMLAATLSIGGTLAYLTDVDTKVNTFTMGEVDIEVEEEFEDGVELNPGAEVNKDAQITNVGENPAWVWMTVAVPSEAAGYIDLVWNGVTPDYTTENVTGDDGNTYTVYTVLVEDQLASGASTAKLLDGVKMDEFVDYRDGKYIHVKGGVETEIDYDLSNLEVIVSGYAVQTEGFDTISEAYAGYGQQWGNQAIPTEEDEDPAIEGNWIDLADDSWYTGDANEYTLSTAEELAGLAKLVNGGELLDGKTIKLGANIDLSAHYWTPIGSGQGNEFRGDFDGQHKTVSGLVVDQANGVGLFGFVLSSDLSNVTLKDVELTTKHYAGALVGNAVASSMVNCHVKNATISCVDEAGEDGDKAGGLAGYLTNENHESVISDCTATNVSITANRDAGAIVGCKQATVAYSDNSVSGCTVKHSGYGTGANLDTDLDGIGRLN